MLMRKKEKILSEYIDSLNAEIKPARHGKPAESAELEELMDTVRKVRSLREPAMPGDGFESRVISGLSKTGPIHKKGASSKSSAKYARNRVWQKSLAAVATIALIAVLAYFILPFGNSNIVHAMERSFDAVKAYHGILEIATIDGQGQETIQMVLDVWADKEGRYHVAHIEGTYDGLITANNGRTKWQKRAEEKSLNVFPAFPDPYRFAFELGKEIELAANAIEIREVGEDTIAGRQTTVLEVTPQGGLSYRIWVDKETKLPLRKQSGMFNAIQYRMTYKDVEFADAIPDELMSLSVPDGFTVVDENPMQLVSSIEEAGAIAGFLPAISLEAPEGFEIERIAVETETKTIKMYFISSSDGYEKAVLSLRRTNSGFEPDAMAVLGKIGDVDTEIILNVQDDLGTIPGGGVYGGSNDICSVRWQHDAYEYKLVANISPEGLTVFIKDLFGKELTIPAAYEEPQEGPMIKVPYDIEVEKNTQKSVDSGSSPWRLDPVYVAQVFVSLEMSPGGIEGDYPIDYDDLSILSNDGVNAIIEVNDPESPISRVYLERLVRQDDTGIWTVVGYDPAP